MKNIVVILFICISTLFINCTDKPEISTINTVEVLNTKSIEALEFCKQHDYNQDFCILIDMSIHSGKKRFFVWDFKSNKVISEYMVAHGCGQNQWHGDESKTNPSFSNIVDSHCSSLGKYKIGKRGWSTYGVNINYRLHGLESTNSNACKRDVVFHSWSAVTDDEVYPSGTIEGWGCPAISNNSFLEIDELLKKTDKPTLMWIFTSKQEV